MKIVFNVNGKKVPLKSLRYISKADQLDVMRKWFYENFENPVESCPHDSEDGYIYIYGGPYEASEELQEMFSQYVNEKLIEDLVDELNAECYEWSANSNNINDWYDDDLYDAVTSSEKPYVKFLENINNIKELSKGKSEAQQKEHLLGLLYTNVITALETLYVELFVKTIEKDDIYVANCIEKGKIEFKVSKDIAALPFKGETIEKMHEELLKAIVDCLINASWHSTNKVVERYKATFGIQVQKNWPINDIEAATLIRNHLVHRGGKDKDGNPVTITEQSLEQLLDHAIALAEKLNESVDDVIKAKEQSDIVASIAKYGF
ncbi:hypothetical protein ACW5WN_01200 [Aeromonas lacus]